MSCMPGHDTSVLLIVSGLKNRVLLRESTDGVPLNAGAFLFAAANHTE